MLSELSLSSLDSINLTVKLNSLKSLQPQSLVQPILILVVPKVIFKKNGITVSSATLANGEPAYLCQWLWHRCDYQKIKLRVVLSITFFCRIVLLNFKAVVTLVSPATPTFTFSSAETAKRKESARVNKNVPQTIFSPLNIVVEIRHFGAFFHFSFFLLSFLVWRKKRFCIRIVMLLKPFFTN